MTPAERWREVEGCASDAMWAVRASPLPERVLAHEAPLPESTVVALARLRAERKRRASSASATGTVDGWTGVFLSAEAIAAFKLPSFVPRTGETSVSPSPYAAPTWTTATFASGSSR